MTQIKAGDVFAFSGLEDEAGVGGGRILTVLGISTGGKVSFRIDMPDGDLKGPGIDSAPLSEVLLMVQEGIWRKTQ